ncbi:UNVERIFIED_CONTAM: ABC transporter family protein [Lysinibacillus xylanilyticus]
MNAIEVHDLQKSFEGFSLNDVSFSVPQGTVMGFVGENGAGKSTTNQLCLGIIASGGFNLFYSKKNMAKFCYSVRMLSNMNYR